MICRSRRVVPVATTAALGLFALSTALAAAAGDSAKGKLTVETESKPASVELAHAYLVTGPESYGSTKIVRRIVFTVADERSTIEACTDASCAKLSTRDGMTLDLGEGSTVDWWVHVHSTQYSGTLPASAFKLSTDTPERVAGTFDLGSQGAMGVIVFDAPFVRAFTQ